MTASRAIRLMLASSVSLLALGAAGSLSANPANGVAEHGAVSIDAVDANTLEIVQSSDKAVINWDSFDIDAGETTRFVVPDAASVTLNRDLSGDPSEIHGALQSNGRLFLVNRSGILFGEGARVDVAGLVATTHDISTEDFAAGRMAFDASGRILALQAILTFPLGIWLPFSALVPAWNAGRILPGPYAIEHVEVHVRAVLTNTAPVGIYRGAGRPEAAMLLERLVDAGARKLGLDPVALRRRNLVTARALPLARANGTVLDSGDFPALLDRTLTLADYERVRSRQSRRRARGELVGLGWCLYVEPCGQGWEWASVTLERDGRFIVAAGSSAQG